MIKMIESLIHKTSINALSENIALMILLQTTSEEKLNRRQLRLMTLYDSVCVLQSYLINLLTSSSFFQLLDNYVATWSVLIICVVECLVVSYIYGVSRFLADIQAMVGYCPWPIWSACWAFLTPTILVIIIILTFLNYEGMIFITISGTQALSRYHYQYKNV